MVTPEGWAGIAPEPIREPDHPVVCVTWDQASAYAAWVGDDARLCSEAEWEVAARSGRPDVHAPWGDWPHMPAEDECDYMVCYLEERGCGRGSTWPVCSHPRGNSLQGACDLLGNAAEWVWDWFHSGYDGAPLDGSPWLEPPTDKRICRGGAWLACQSAIDRHPVSSGYIAGYIGIRLCRNPL